jgi:predicted RNA-binding Zn-ribbon protein involved in translation (DUF1610 family)
MMIKMGQGIIICPDCGKPITGAWDNRNNKWVYHCSCGYEQK